MQRLFNRATKILLSTDMVVLVAIAMLGPFYTVYVEKIGGDLLIASLSLAAFAFAAGVTSLINSKIIYKVKETELAVVLGYTLIGFGFAFYIFVDSLATLFLVQIFIGVAAAIYAPASALLHQKHINNSRVGRLWGDGKSLDYFSMAIGALVGSLIVTYFGFVVLFIFMTAFCWIGASYIYFLPRKVL